jgi:hypothetical protein
MKKKNGGASAVGDSLKEGKIKQGKFVSDMFEKSEKEPVKENIYLEGLEQIYFARVQAKRLRKKLENIKEQRIVTKIETLFTYINLLNGAGKFNIKDDILIIDNCLELVIFDFIKKYFIENKDIMCDDLINNLQKLFHTEHTDGQLVLEDILEYVFDGEPVGKELTKEEREKYKLAISLDIIRGGNIQSEATINIVGKLSLILNRIRDYYSFKRDKKKFKEKEINSKNSFGYALIYFLFTHFFEPPSK